MAVETEVEVALACGEEIKEVLSKHGNGKLVVGEDTNGVGNTGSGSGDSKSESDSWEEVDQAKNKINGAAIIGSGSLESKANSNSSDEVEKAKNKIRIMVSGKKKPLFFYINLAKKYLMKSYDVELSALGLAIPTVITLSEFLKRNGLATEKNVRISTVNKTMEEKGRVIVKAQIEILLGKCDKLDAASDESSSNLVPL